MKNKLLQYILPFQSQVDAAFEQNRQQYQDWDKHPRLVQVRTICFITVALYIAFTFIDKSAWANEMEALMLRLHLFINVPILLTIGVLAFYDRLYKVVMVAMALAPLVGVLCHINIASQMPDPSYYLAEAYILVSWIFVVSGMPFRYALISATVSSVLFIVSAYFYMSDRSLYVIYVFWICCSYSLGFFGGLIFDTTRKTIFINMQKLQRLATTDPLTGLFNRNQLNSVMREEIERSVRYPNTFGVLMVDIDHFKKINDTFGHDVGDEVLLKTAHVLSRLTRQNDTLIRWGGEEFIIIALQMDIQNLRDFCEKLRHEIENEHFGNSKKITVSIGATLFKEGDTQETLISRADDSLYKAKEKGRNLTVLKP